MSKPLQELALRPESAGDIRRTCKEDLDHYPDATLHLQLQLQLAIANDDFERAALCARPPPWTSTIYLEALRWRSRRICCQLHRHAKWDQSQAINV